MLAASSPPSPSAGDCGQELSSGQQAASFAQEMQQFVFLSLPFFKKKKLFFCVCLNTRIYFYYRCTYTYIPLNTHMDLQTCMFYTQLHSYTISTCKHTCTCTHQSTYTNTDTHTHPHTYRYQTHIQHKYMFPLRSRHIHVHTHA